MKSKSDPYNHCILRRGLEVTTTWLPRKYSLTGKMLKLRFAGEWTNGWIVEQVGCSMPFEYLLRHERDFAHQREASDI